MAAKYPADFRCRECGAEWTGEVEDLGYEFNYLPREDCPECGSDELEAEEAGEVVL